MTAHNSNLLTTTDDPITSTTDAFARPKAGDAPLRWFVGTKPRFYRPYLIRVVAIDAAMMEFVFLHGRTGEDLELSKKTFQIAHHDGRYTYSDLPSTAHLARPGTKRDCGILLISDEYMKDLQSRDRTTLAGSETGEGKWPASRGRFAELVTRLRGQLGGDASAQDEADLAALVELLRSVP